MKATVIAISAILAASFAVAAETTVQTATAPPDSPLVRAAKKNDRAKKRIVITNESLKASTGHVTTTKFQPPVYQPPVLAISEQEYQKQHPQPAKAPTAEAKKAPTEAERNARKERLAAEEDEGIFSEQDPAALEHRLEKNAQQAPKQEQKKP